MRRLKKLFKIGKETALDLYSYLLFGFLSTPTINNRINPCKFCGSEDVEIVSFLSISEFVLCNGCLCQGPPALSSNGVVAIEYWNNGTTPFTKPYWARKN